MVSLQDLQLEAARALVGAGQLPADAEPARYLQALIDGLCELSLKDPLTGLSNRRQLFTVIDCELDRVARSGEAALLLMLDIDHFKHINDAHGHVAGDQVLQAVSRVLADSVRPMDTLVRFGGEEFAIVLPACHAAFGKSVAERIRRAVEAVRVPISPTQELQVTVSVGGAFALQWIRSTRKLWLERADQQLYRSKSSGRNCVHIEEQPDSTVSAEEKSLLFGPLTHMPSTWADVSEDAAAWNAVDEPAGSVN
ncbi:GGDEF domain-containing protein [Comamonas sp. CMM01]|jgi:diguanylate cyclase (GGDEF)-like protein|uniref:GGDEF domain-containing protein n=1 Tax=Comamonas sp. CMM01 TaxID=2769280 RepID=UPI001785674B|nr:GGDEF domain-containing protein [Comamonas sp. CMM01]MBD9530593.1 GGDEF domain-containing protein [Comamonas sp. CMM01]